MNKFEAMREQLKQGVKVVSAPRLFPTPHHIAALMVDYAEIQESDVILEPSAGTGAIMDELMQVTTWDKVHLVEINRELASGLASKYKRVYPGDFLEKTSFELYGPFDKIVMNPPFKNGEDIKHINHALSMLKPDGVLVGICANGPRQQAKIKPLASHWEPLLPGTFHGTGVNAALFII